MMLQKQKVSFFLLSMFFLTLVIACSNTVSSVDDLEQQPTSGGSTQISSSSIDSLTSSSSVVETPDSLTLDSLGYRWVQVPAQTFVRGISNVTISAFQMTDSEISQEKYKALMALPEQKNLSDSLPVANVSWYDAVLFCNALAKSNHLDTAYAYDSLGSGGVLLGLRETAADTTIRLPTEAEWEVAARAGTTTKYYWGNALASDYANYATAEVVSVKSFLPNAYGLFDMAGNVSEWTNDWYSAYPNNAEIENPKGPSSGTKKVFRGGSFSTTLKMLANDERNSAIPTEKLYNRGFRVVKVCR